MSKENLYKVFTIKDPVLVSLLLKMIHLFKETKHNRFSLLRPSVDKEFETEKDFALAPSKNIFYSIKKQTKFSNGGFDLSSSMEKNKENKENTVLRKLRLFKTEFVFDSITFSHDFIGTIEDLLSCFDSSKLPQLNFNLKFPTIRSFAV